MAICMCRMIWKYLKYKRMPMDKNVSVEKKSPELSGLDTLAAVFDAYNEGIAK